jgi:hypothetical protein
MLEKRKTNRDAIIRRLKQLPANPTTWIGKPA